MSTSTTTSTAPATDYATEQEIADCQQLIRNLQAEMIRATTLRAFLRIERELTDAQTYLATLQQPQS
jgi:hypothetical protein